MFDFISNIFSKDEPVVRRSVLASIEEAKDLLKEAMGILGSPNEDSLMREEDISRIAGLLPLIPDDVRVVTVSWKDAGALYGARQAGAFFTTVMETPVVVVNVFPRVMIVDYHSLVAHELVHYEQWVRGDLKFLGNGIEWKGEVYSPEFQGKGMRKLIETEVLNKPWEVEAYARTSGGIEAALSFTMATKRHLKQWRKDNL